MCRKIRHGVMMLILAGSIVAHAQEPDVTDEPVKEYTLQYEKPEESREYYKERPEIKIIHQDQRYITYYELLRSGKTVLEGKLNEENSQKLIEDVQFQEGTQELHIWMEIIPVLADEPREKINEKKIEFKIDTKEPENLGFVYAKDEEKIICSKEPYKLVLEASDEMSGVQSIVYQIGEIEKTFDGKSVEVILPKNYDGRVLFYALDYAGNQSRVLTSRRIICDDQKPEIEIITPKGTNVWYTQEIPITVNIIDKDVSAGIESYRYYEDGVLQSNKKIEEIGKGKVSFSLNITKGSTGMNGTRILVECRDYAGNDTCKEIVLYMDLVKPIIEIEGIKNGQITSQKIKGKIQFSDETKIQEGTIWMSFENTDGEKQTMQKSLDVTGGNQIVYPVKMEKSGIYVIRARVIDIAGHVTTKKIQTIVDMDNPVIRYVEKINGQELQQFNWNYQPSDMIYDFTHFSYKMMLDKNPYIPGTAHKEEGQHIITVKAVDGAGNESNAQGTFKIDRTRPKILYQGIEAEGIYEDEVIVTIQTENVEDQIQTVVINGKTQIDQHNLQNKKYRIKEQKNHKIEVRAVDKAGNIENSEIRFEIIPSTNILKRTFDEKTNKKVKVVDSVDTKRKTNFKYVIGIGGFTCFVLIIIGSVLWHKRKTKLFISQDM